MWTVPLEGVPEAQFPIEQLEGSVTIADSPCGRPSPVDHGQRGRVSLTPREQEVLLLLKEGMRNSEISERLVISPQTTKHHLAAIYHKLGAENRTQALTKAVALGLVTLD